jgi:hypothetical protein
VPFPNVTVFPDGTATNSEGTPVVLPTAQPAPAGTPAAAPSAQATAGVSSGAVISLAVPADAAGDFMVDVMLGGVTNPYVAFNIYVTFDPSILTAILVKPGTALAPTPDETFCVRAPASTGTIGLGCTVLQASTATNGLLATIKFHQVSAGTAQLHLRTVAEGSSTTGTYISTPRPGSQLLPDVVTLVDGSVTLP